MLSYLYRVGIALSVLLNVIAGGHINQTFSARNYMWAMQGRPNLIWLIDFLFVLIGTISLRGLNIVRGVFGMEPLYYDFRDHCLVCWVHWRLRKDVLHDYKQGIIKDAIELATQEATPEPKVKSNQETSIYTVYYY